ncbi:MAG: glycosyltransferase family 9 protein [Bacteroidota bacterium]|nr:glycosyltransferase family 9 protein [Bacteroidota bacterium]
MIDAKNILMIKLRAIGDVLLSTPAIYNMRQAYPNATIDFLTEEFAADVVRGNPWVNDVITFSKKRDSSFGLLRTVRSRRYDLVIDLFCNPRSALVTKISGARTRAGYPFRGRRYAYNSYVSPRSDDVHNVEFNLDALRRLDIPIVSSQPFFPIDDRSKIFAGDWLKKENLTGKTIVALNPSGSWETKRWGLQHFADFGDRVAEKYDAEIVLVWGPDEEGDAATIQMRMKHRPHIIPRTSLKQLGAILQRCSYVVSNDSGPMHIAAAVRVPTLGIFGPTTPRLQGPYGEKHAWVRNEGLDCLECNLTKCPIGNICMTQLEVGRVVPAFDALVKKNPERAAN